MSNIAIEGMETLVLENDITLLYSQVKKLLAGHRWLHKKWIKVQMLVQTQRIQGLSELRLRYLLAIFGAAFTPGLPVGHACMHVSENLGFEPRSPSAISQSRTRQTVLSGIGGPLWGPVPQGVVFRGGAAKTKISMAMGVPHRPFSAAEPLLRAPHPIGPFSAAVHKLVRVFRPMGQSIQLIFSPFRTSDHRVHACMHAICPSAVTAPEGIVNTYGQQRVRRVSEAVAPSQTHTRLSASCTLVGYTV